MLLILVSYYCCKYIGFSFALFLKMHRNALKCTEMYDKGIVKKKSESNLSLKHTFCMRFNPRSHRRATFAKRYLHIVEIQDTNSKAIHNVKNFLLCDCKDTATFVNDQIFASVFFCGQKKDRHKKLCLLPV